jgi:hypothetical protein
MSEPKPLCETPLTPVTRGYRPTAPLWTSPATPCRCATTMGKGVRVTPGAFMRSDLPIAGFAVIEADSVDHAAE